MPQIRSSVLSPLTYALGQIRRKVPIHEMTEKIDQVDNNTIRRVAARIFGPSSGGKPTVVCMGHEDTGSYNEVFRKYGLAASV